MPKIEKLSQEMVDKYDACYMDALHRLFDHHKVKFDCSDTQELEGVELEKQGHRSHLRGSYP